MKTKNRWIERKLDELDAKEQWGENEAQDYRRLMANVVKTAR